MWFKYSIAGLGLVIPFTFITAYIESQHHEHERMPYDHLRIRVKPFPWSSKDCDLFDSHCKHQH